MTSLDPANVHRILIRANNWIGDVVMISPAVRAIREHFAGARISILAKSWVLDTLRGNPFYDELIEYDRAGVHAGVAGRWRLVRELRAARFDLAVLFQKAFEAAALTALAGVRARVGYPTDFRRSLLTHAVPLPAPGTHHAQGFLQIVRALGCPVRDTRPLFHIDAADRDRARTLLGAPADSGAEPLIAIHPGASKAPRSWHPERFARLGERLATRLGARIVLLGGPGDGPTLDRIAQSIPVRSVIRPARVPSIKEMGGILERCHLFLGNDSGPMHIAAALGVPTVAIFGPGAPGRTSPLALPGRLSVVTKSYPCSPCRQDFFRECPPSASGKPFCLEEIDPEEVAEAAIALFRTVHGARSGGAARPGPPDQTSPP